MTEIMLMGRLCISNGEDQRQLIRAICVLKVLPMELEGYIKTMAESCALIYEEMTGLSTGGVKIEALESPYTALTYKTAIVIPYENKEEVMTAAAHNIKGYIKKPIKMDKLLSLAHSCFQD